MESFFLENLAAFILCLFLLSLASKERISNDGCENYRKDNGHYLDKQFLGREDLRQDSKNSHDEDDNHKVY